MSIWDQILFAFWFFLPAGLANMFPIFAAKVPVLKDWDYPLDFNLTYRGKRIFGTNKTIRGVIVAMVIGTVTALLLDQTAMLGFLLGSGAILGDAVESFFKRQLNIPEGQSWFVFDQIDYIIGAILFTYWYAPLPWDQYAYAVIVYFVLHLVSTNIGYWLGLKQKAI